MPAPPAPTMTTSYRWTCTTTPPLSGRAEAGEVRGRAAGRAGVEREDHERAEDDHDDEGGVQQRLQPEPGLVAVGVVVDDRPDAVRAVQHRQPQHEQVPDLPERARPLAGHEGEVDVVDALADHEVDEEVPEDEHEQDDAGEPHEHPGVELVVRARRLGPLVRAARCVERGCGHGGRPSAQAPKTLPRCRIRNGTIRTTHRPTTAHSICRCSRVPRCQKSTSITRTPLSAWNTTAATRPASPSPTIGFL